MFLKCEGVTNTCYIFSLFSFSLEAMEAVIQRSSSPVV